MNNPVQRDHEALAAELLEMLDVVDATAVADTIIERAFRHGATDVHLDPVETGIRLRFRVDGALRDIIHIPRNRCQTILSRLKVISGMNIAERRLPQDGHISSHREGSFDRDVRVGTSPTLHGERAVLRLMPDPGEYSTLESLGFYEQQLSPLRGVLSQPYGLVLIVGPVGAGKSTTIYNFLQELNRPDRSVVTIEDPVERQMPGAMQIQVDNRTGLTFATALRGTLRQDPDVLAVGEIRDAETAQIACRAAMTGVLVLSTLHANNAVSAIDVLRQFKVPPLTIADCLKAVVCQRLVRKVCPESRETYTATDLERKLLCVEGTTEGPELVRGTPADCNFRTGYQGRTAIFETLIADRAIRNGIFKNASSDELMEHAQTAGMITLEESGRRKVLEQVTSVEEYRRILADTGRLPTLTADN